MQVVTKYLAFDGTMCNTKEACLAYEFRLKLVKILHTEWDALCRPHNGPIPLETTISFF